MDEGPIPSAVVLEGVSKTYRGGLCALHPLDLRIDRGDLVFLVGRSGAGKTTLLRLISMEERPTSGRVVVDGDFDSNSFSRSWLAALRRRLGLVFQDFRLLFDRSVFENVALPLRIGGEPSHRVPQKVVNALAKVGLSHRAPDNPGWLSAGEQQRVCIARAIVNAPVVLLADEPTGNLDSETAEGVYSVIRDIGRSGTAVLVATHSQAAAERSGARVIHLDRGKIVGSVRSDRHPPDSPRQKGPGVFTVSARQPQG